MPLLSRVAGSPGCTTLQQSSFDSRTQPVSVIELVDTTNGAGLQSVATGGSLYWFGSAPDRNRDPASVFECGSETQSAGSCLPRSSTTLTALRRAARNLISVSVSSSFLNLAQFDLAGQPRLTTFALQTPNLLGCHSELEFRSRGAELCMSAWQKRYCSKHSLPVHERTIQAAQIYDHVAHRAFFGSDDLQVPTADEVVGLVVPHVAFWIATQNDLTSWR
jgi:hypothetical protein